MKLWTAVVVLKLIWFWVFSVHGGRLEVYSSRLKLDYRLNKNNDELSIKQQNISYIIIYFVQMYN